MVAPSTAVTATVVGLESVGNGGPVTLAVLALLAVVAVAVTGFVLALGLRLFDRAASNPDRPLMPSHYSSLVHTDVSNYPGYCTECGTSNDPTYDVCRNCSSPLRTTRGTEVDWDPEQVFSQ